MENFLTEIAKDGAWAVFCLYLAFNLIREGRANREAHVRNTEVLSRLATLIEGSALIRKDARAAQDAAVAVGDEVLSRLASLLNRKELP